MDDSPEAICRLECYTDIRNAQSKTEHRAVEVERKLEGLNRMKVVEVCKMLVLLIIYESLMFDNKVQILYASKKGVRRKLEYVFFMHIYIFRTALENPVP